MTSTPLVPSAVEGRRQEIEKAPFDFALRAPLRTSVLSC
jgi:hypothetical protein